MLIGRGSLAGRFTVSAAWGLSKSPVFVSTLMADGFLEALWEEEGLTAGEIGKRLSLDNATVSGVLDRLADADWIKKEIDPEDKRILRIYLSEKALKKKMILIKERTQANNEILQKFSQEERVLLKRLLRDFL